MRENQPVEVNGREETHPAFAVGVVTRTTGTSRALFQSDLLHRETVTLRFSRARRIRDLSQDWVFPHGKDLLEVEMSLAQWAQLVASSGQGSGTPVTVRAVNQEATPGIPFNPRTQESVQELKNSVEKLLGDLKAAMTQLNQLEDAKAGIRERRAAREKVTRLIESAPRNVEFVATQLDEHVENVVAQAKSDIESMVLSAADSMTQLNQLEILT